MLPHMAQPVAQLRPQMNVAAGPGIMAYFGQSVCLPRQLQEVTCHWRGVNTPLLSRMYVGKPCITIRSKVSTTPFPKTRPPKCLTIAWTSSGSKLLPASQAELSPGEEEASKRFFFRILLELDGSPLFALPAMLMQRRPWTWSGRGRGSVVQVCF